ncbi:MAG TPA: efflux transporter outer membrane subunit [Gammaproteobacteria bacterium]|nr:efflux transporter outer membrane subunit [Gammaproteobacteria bacterium]
MHTLKKTIFLLCLFLNACMVGPNYKEPVKPIAKHWKKNNSTVNEKPFCNPHWWESFHDPTLTALIYKGYTSNLSLQSMGVKVLQARAELAQSVGELYPQQQALIGNYTYSRIGGGSLQNLLPNEIQTAALGFTLNWELDFWGKYRRAILSNNAAFLASIAAYDDALITLTADIASSYIKIRTIQAQIKVILTNIEVQKIGLQLAEVRYRSGQTSLIDVEQAKTALSETQSKLPTLRAQLQVQKDVLSILMGEPPNQIDAILNTHRGIPTVPLSVAVGIPKEALAKRPDIYQARFEAIAQSEMIGATKANLFPAFSLNGTFAFAANNIGTSSVRDIFHWSNRTVTAGPALNWPFLNYGQITNAVRVQDAAFQQALLNYINLVLKAQAEVQDNITTFVESKLAKQFLVKADRAAKETLKLALIQYKEGEIDFTPVLYAEQQQLRVQSSLINAEGDSPEALVSLYRSLGGGWEIRRGNDVIPNSMKREMAARTNWGDLLQQKEHQVPANSRQWFRQLYLPQW